MVRWLNKFFFNESEELTPQVSGVGNAFKRKNFTPNETVLAYDYSGVHPNSDKWEGIAGEVAVSLGTVNPLVGDSYYFGIYPLNQQPLLDSPKPWSVFNG